MAMSGVRGRRPLPCLPVRPVAAAVRAVLLELDPVGAVTPVLAGDVVAVLALLACQRDLGPNVCRSHDGVPFSRIDSSGRLAGTWWYPCGSTPKDSGPRNRRAVAEAGLEPATQRL